MPLSPGKIKDKLTDALDVDKNVINEEAVEEVITLLEASTLTKEILEQTRLGRDINLVRKSCKNPLIAKRAKNLVKSWQKLLVGPGSPQVLNGQHTSVPSPHQRISPAQRMSPGFLPVVGRANASNRCLPSPALSQVKHQQLKGAGVGSPGVQLSEKPLQVPAKPNQYPKSVTAKSPRPVPISASIINNGDSNLSWPGTPPVASENTQDRLAADDSSKQDGTRGSSTKNNQPGSKKFNFDAKPIDHSNVVTSKSEGTSDQRDVSKTNVANRKRTRVKGLEDSNSSCFPSSKQPRLFASSPSLSASAFIKNDVINGSLLKCNLRSPVSVSALNSSAHNLSDVSAITCLTSPRINVSRQESVNSRLSVHSADCRSSRSKANRVKTTEQIIEDMQLRSASSVGTEVIAQIRTQQIQLESDQQKVDPPSLGQRRGRKKKKVGQQLSLTDTEEVSEGRKLAQTKSEYIERFLRTSVAPTPGEDIYEPPISHCRQESVEEPTLALGECSSTFSQSVYESGFPSYPSRQDKPDSGPSASPPEAREILGGTINMHLVGEAGTSERLAEGQILACLPPIDYANIDWASSDYFSPQPVQVMDESVNMLHGENMEGVNGTYDRNGQFRQWAELLTMDSVYDDPLYILPYVIPND